MLVRVLAMLAPLVRCVNMEAGGAYLGATLNPDLPSTQGPRALWTPPPRARVTNLFWAHIPKTSTSFGRTFFSYACGHDADDFASVLTTRPAAPQQSGACTGSIAEEQDAIVNATIDRAANAEAHNSSYYLSWYHMGLPWAASEPNVGAEATQASPMPPVAGVTMFRRPSERLLSEYRQLTWAGHECCSDNTDPLGVVNTWAWDQKTSYAAINAAQGKIFPPDMSGPPPHCYELNLTGLACRSELAPFDPTLNTTAARVRRFTEVVDRADSLFGCQTKMLLGYGCHEAHALTAYEVARARAYVQHSAPERLFIGLTHRYNESVCLFHAQLGGSLWDFELLEGQELSREMPAADPTVAPFNGAASDAIFSSTARFLGYRSDAHLLRAADFAGGVKDPDTEIFMLAEARFEAALTQHRAEVDECLSHVQ